MRLMASNFACLDRLGGASAPAAPVTHNAQLLPQGKIERIEAVPGTRVRCVTGKLWITLAGDSGDYILSTGESFTAPAAGLLLAEALSTSSFIVDDVVDPARKREHAGN